MMERLGQNTLTSNVMDLGIRESEQKLELSIDYGSRGGNQKTSYTAVREMWAKGMMWNRYGIARRASGR